MQGRLKNDVRGFVVDAIGFLQRSAEGGAMTKQTMNSAEPMTFPMLRIGTL